MNEFELGLPLTVLSSGEREKDSKDMKLVVAAVEPFYEQRVDELIEKASKNAEPRKSKQEKGISYEWFLLLTCI